jgi:hypothetical protein
MSRTISIFVGLFLLSSAQTLFGSVSFHTDYWLPGAGNSAVTLYKADLSGVYQTLTTYNGGPIYTSNWSTNPPNGQILTGPIFCIEIPEDIFVPSNVTYDPGVVDLELAPVKNGNQGSPPMGADAATAIRRLWGMHFADITNADKRGAFQLVLWELSYDHGTGGFSDGLLRASGSSNELTIATSWLADSLSTDPRLANLKALSDDSHQDQVGEVPGSSSNEVPEPTTLVVWLLLGMGTCLGQRVWRRRRAG